MRGKNLLTFRRNPEETQTEHEENVRRGEVKGLAVALPIQSRLGQRMRQNRHKGISGGARKEVVIKGV